MYEAQVSTAQGAQPVLIVDDEETIRSLLTMIVVRAGGQAETADCVKKAKEMAGARTYAAAVVDKNLPDGSGIDLCGHLRETSPTTQVLIVTGYANTESAVEALRLGAFDYIMKPFDVAAVTHRLKLALERRRLQGELARAMDELKRTNLSLDEARQEVSRAYLETVLRLSRAAEYRDEGAADHVRRISRYAGILARAVDGTETFVSNIMCAAPLHDIGKIGVSEAILRKAGPLSPSELREVRGHVEIGARILDGASADVLVLAREIITTHHERWDGSGYPRGTRGNDIPLAGRIVALVDSWDAVSTDRPYRRAMPFEKAVAEIQAGAGTMYDPQLVDAFFDRIEQVRAVMDEGRPQSVAR